MYVQNSMKDVFVFDDIIPDWLYNATLNEISSIPITFGHRGYGPNQGNVFFSSVWPNYELHRLPWFFKATFAALESNISRLGNTVDVILNQCQLNYTTKTLTGGLHIDVNPEVASWTMVHLIAGDSGLDFWSDMPEDGGDRRNHRFGNQGRRQGCTTQLHPRSANAAAAVLSAPAVRLALASVARRPHAVCARS